MVYDKQAAVFDHARPLTPTDVIVPKPLPPALNEDMAPTADEKLMAEQIIRQNRELMRAGLRKAGISERTIETLATIESMAPNAGEFLVASVDLTHRMMVLQTVRLFEEAQNIKERYLDDMTLDITTKIEWQRAYNEITDMLGRSYDRTLTGTQAMAKLLGTEKEGERKKPRPGFRPLRRVT